MHADHLSPRTLQALLDSSDELALIDVREARQFAQGHLSLARHVPLSTLELRVATLVPRRDTHIVLCDAAGTPDGETHRAQAVLRRLGYTTVQRLVGGVAAWSAAGLMVVDGYHTLVKAFADLARRHYGTATLSVADLAQRLREADPPHVIDARPREEHRFLTIPGSVNIPGTELALRAPIDSKRTWAVHCFSRTRGIVGATTLGILGITRHAAFVEDGVMAWGLDDGPLVQNAESAYVPPEASDETLRARAAELRARHGLRGITPSELEAFHGDTSRTLHVFDVRPSSPRTGVPGVRHVPGGQLLMHFESHVVTRGARIVLVDDAHGLRAAVTSFWISQLAQAEVFILDGDLPPLRPHDDTPIDESPGADAIDATTLTRLLRDSQAEVIDVGPSLDYEQAHIPGAHFMVGASLSPLEALFEVTSKTLVFVSPDDTAARLIARDASQRWPERRIVWLRGGLAAWRAHGGPLQAAHRPEQRLTPFDDDWGSVMRIHGAARDEAWIAYLEWERGIAARIAEDHSVRFRFFPVPVTTSS